VAADDKFWPHELDQSPVKLLPAGVSAPVGILVECPPLDVYVRGENQHASFGLNHGVRSFHQPSLGGIASPYQRVMVSLK